MNPSLFPWLQENILGIAAVVITMVLVYHFLIQRDSGVRLSKKYRSGLFEAQSKIFLNATQYLISGNKDLAIKEFLNAVDLNRETIDTYFALGGLFRSNGEIEKAISIHRSLIARENISEHTRLAALKELARDFDKGGFIEKAIETYKEVLKIDSDRPEVIKALCRIYEDIEDWDQAYAHRIMLSRICNENQSETISHILAEKAKGHFANGDFKGCSEILDDAFRFAPTVTAKILKTRLHLLTGNLEDAKALLLEILKEHPVYASFVTLSLKASFKASPEYLKRYETGLSLLNDYFLGLSDPDFVSSPSVVLAKLRLLKEARKIEDAYGMLSEWMKQKESPNEVMEIEYAKILIEMGKGQEAIAQTARILGNLHKSLARHYCSQCGYNADTIFWRCPQCKEWETIQFRFKV
jgi:lipopolysaccharide biosynthesis regulator YciM